MAIPSAAQNQEHWSGRAAFILAAVGSAVGLGNLWRFPYVAGESGGGAFVIFYLLCIGFIGLPVLMAELLIGRRGGGSAVAAISRLAKAEGQSRLWAGLGWMGTIASFFIVSFYSVIAGWVLHFALISVVDLIEAMMRDGVVAMTGPAFSEMSQEAAGDQLSGLLASPGRMIAMHAIFMALTVFIVSRGVKGGIEKAATILMPVFFGLLLLLTISSLVRGNAGEAFSFLFAPKFGAFFAGFTDGSILLNAIGQAFFSLSLGSVMMITYGLYLGRDESIPSSAKIVAGTDTLVAIIAGLAIFPIVFAAGAAPGAGPGLLFSTLPLIFHDMAFGGLFAIAFFFMALFAALTSAIALLEVAVAFFDGDVNVDPERRARRRLIGAIGGGLVAFILGVGHALSQSSVESFFTTWHPLGFIPLFEGQVLLDAIDNLTANVLLPLGGLLTSVFAGWAISSSAAEEELGFKTRKGFKIWQFLCRWVAPIFVGAVLLFATVISPLIAASQERGSEAAQVIEDMVEGE